MGQQCCATFAADKTATHMEIVWSKNGIPLMNHHCTKVKDCQFAHVDAQQVQKFKQAQLHY